MSVVSTLVSNNFVLDVIIADFLQAAVEEIRAIDFRGDSFTVLVEVFCSIAD